MLHLNDQTMPIYQQKVTGEVKELEQRYQALKQGSGHADSQTMKMSHEELGRLESRFTEIEEKLSQLADAPKEMRERLRSELDEALEDLRLAMKQAAERPGDET